MPGSPVWREDDDVHWLTEVIGGFSLGLAYLLATIWLVESYRRRTVRAETVSLAGGDLLGEPADSLPGAQAPTPASRRV